MMNVRKWQFAMMALMAGLMAGAEEWTDEKTRGLERRAMEAVADLALVPPSLITAPVPAKYRAANEVWAMNNGAALTPKGRLWASWIGGGDSPDAYTTCAFSDDNGETWNPPALVVDGHDPKRIPFPRSNIIANLWTDPAGVLHLFVSQSMWHNDGRMGVWETTCANPDDAKPAWSPIRRLCDGAALNKPIVLRNGTWLLPVELPRTWGPWSGLFGTSSTDAGAIALASTDGGKTWQRRGGVTVPDSDWPENHFLELKDGTIRMYMRSRLGLRMTESRDEGRTWGEVTKPAGMDQPCARCQVRALASGNWIFVKHLSPPDSYNDNKRIGQIAYLSRDEGKTWEGGLVLDDRKSVTYPDVEQGPDGTIYVTHDFERGREAEIILHRFTEADILAKRFQSPQARQGIVVTKAMGTKHNRRARHCGYWLHGGTMKDVDVRSLVSFGTTDVFLHEHAFAVHGQKDVEEWIARATAAGLKVHIWLQAFYNGKWINPVKDGKPDSALFDEMIARAQSHARIPGVAGIHLDYVRYPGTAFKTPGGTGAVSEFVRLAATRLHQTSPRLVVSAALMPETTSNEHYYGQDYAAISKHLDVVIPMIYKGNYKKTTPWIASTTKWYVKNSKGAQVWAGLQGYKSDEETTPLPTPEITADVKAALDAGAAGAVLFRWGVTNFVKLSSIR